MMTSRLCHVWLCDVASPIPSCHRLRRGGVTFLDSTSFAASLCSALAAVDLFTYLLWFLYIVQFCILVCFRCRFIWNLMNLPVTCRSGCLARYCFVCSRIDFSRKLDDYIMVDHAVNRSLGWADVLSVCMSGVVHRFAGGEFGDSSWTVGCVGESYIDEPLVGTIILPQIGELPVHLSIGEV